MRLWTSVEAVEKSAAPNLKFDQQELAERCCEASLPVSQKEDEPVQAAQNQRARKKPARFRQRKQANHQYSRRNEQPRWM
ncbi:MAG TPA: hypothetical protein VJO53_11500 [Candidatus Acidoferrales bacterium]|nr:hypothetical protein [Candidatus Acidoferrales bacterium]